MADITRIGTGARMSEAVCYNGIVWLAGQVGNPGDSVADQTRTCLAEVDRLLAAAGTDKTRILSAQIWLADIADFAEMNKVWDAWVPQGHTPARARHQSTAAKPQDIKPWRFGLDRGSNTKTFTSKVIYYNIFILNKWF